MFEERDRKKFGAFTAALLHVGKRHRRIRHATHRLCESIVRVAVSPSHRFDDAQSDLANSAYVLDAEIKGLHVKVRQRVLGTAPRFMSELRCAHEPRLRNVCNGVVREAARIWCAGSASKRV